MGLPGSGKTTLADELAPLLNAKRLNADEVRKEANDWDFSEEGRKRQAKRMADFALKLKQDRNLASPNLLQIFRKAQTNGQVYSILGNPNLAEVRGILIGVENTNATTPNACADVW